MNKIIMVLLLTALLLVTAGCGTMQMDEEVTLDIVTTAPQKNVNPAQP